MSVWRLNGAEVAAGYCLVTHYHANGAAKRQEVYDPRQHLCARQTLDTRNEPLVVEHWELDHRGDSVHRVRSYTCGYAYTYCAKSGAPLESSWFDRSGRLQTRKQYCPRSGTVILRQDL